MKIKIRPDEAGSLDDAEWTVTDDWLARLRDDDREQAEASAPAGHAAMPAAPPAAPAAPRPCTGAPLATPAPAVAPAPAAAPGPDPAGPDLANRVRAVIGDELRRPTAWCEMGSCISFYAEPGALGEADNRARAITAGWRVDAFGRLACPRCQGSHPGFRTRQPVVAWDRGQAMATAARLAVPRAGSRPDRAPR